MKNFRGQQREYSRSVLLFFRTINVIDTKVVSAYAGKYFTVTTGHAHFLSSDLMKRKDF